MNDLIILQAQRDTTKMADNAQELNTRKDGSKARVQPIHAINYFYKSWVDMGAKTGTSTTCRVPKTAGLT
jgi:hypothetical protein